MEVSELFETVRSPEMIFYLICTKVPLTQEGTDSCFGDLQKPSVSGFTWQTSHLIQEADISSGSLRKRVSNSPLRQMLSLFSCVFRDVYGRCSVDVFKEPWWTDFMALRWAKEMDLPQRVRSDALRHLMFSLPSSTMNNLTKSILKFRTTQIQNKLLTRASPT